MKTKNLQLATFFASLLLLIVSSSCGSDMMDEGLTKAQREVVEKKVKEIEDRQDVHYAKMKDSNDSSELQAEMDSYKDDMEGMMDDLEENLSDYQNCRMELNNHVSGDKSDKECDDNDYLESVDDETHRHYDDTQPLIDSNDNTEILSELDKHIQSMEKNMSGMMSHMDDKHGTHMMDD